MRTQMIWVSLICWTMAGSGMAAAQSMADRAAAEQLFQEGRALMKQGNFPAACPKLEASFALDPALGTQLNLAACYEHSDRPASAWVHYRAVVDRAQQAGQVSRAELARKRAAVVEPRVPRLVVRVPEAARVPGLVVMRDDTVLVPALFDTPLYVDAGEHHVHAAAPGHAPFALAVRLAAGEERVVEVRLPAPVPVAVPVPNEPGPAPRRDPWAGPVAPEHARDTGARVPGSKTEPGAAALHARALGRSSRQAAAPARHARRTLAWVSGGTGAAGVIFGLGLGWMARQSLAHVLGGGLCDPVSRVCMDVDSLDQLERARSHARAADIAVGSGVALMAVGAVLYWTSRDRDDHGRSARVVPTAGATDIGLSVIGRF